ncbi:hypothetical protein M2347_003430 [Chryseobacterium sp. H1D6B]|nr:hypothetical protein [Chryseobacterium sp. H1D6B]
MFTVFYTLKFQFFFVILHPIIAEIVEPTIDIDNKNIKKQDNAKIKNEIRC